MRSVSMTIVDFTAKEEQHFQLKKNIYLYAYPAQFLTKCSFCDRKERAEGLEKASRLGHRKNPERLDKIGDKPTTIYHLSD